jgi:hypothetical protein
VNEELGSKIRNFRYVICQEVFVSHNNKARLVPVVKLYSCRGIVSSAVSFFFFFVLKVDVKVGHTVLKFAGYSARRCFKKPIDLINDLFFLD